MMLHQVTFTPEDAVENFPIVNNPSKKTSHIEDFGNLVEAITINHQSFVITKTLAAALRCLRDRGGASISGLMPFVLINRMYWTEVVKFV
jgi:hypothetical protein